MTYSIVARDEATGQLGVAVQSHYFGVGRMIGWADPGVGAVATQGFFDVGHGPAGLAGMRSGLRAEQAMEQVLAEDPGREGRQVAMVDAAGRVAVHTGSESVEFAGHIVGDGVSCQGNMLASGGCWQEMLVAYEASEGAFFERLLDALDAGEASGGDARGSQSASLFVVGGDPTLPRHQQVQIDVRVDDSATPVPELRRLASLQRFYDDLIPVLGEEGLFTGEPTASPARVAEVLEDLERGEVLLGRNQEALMWGAVLLVRFSRTDEARDKLVQALELRSELLPYLRRLAASAGFVDQQAFDRVVDDALAALPIERIVR